MFDVIEEAFKARRGILEEAAKEDTPPERRQACLEEARGFLEIITHDDLMANHRVRPRPAQHERTLAISRHQGASLLILVVPNVIVLVACGILGTIAEGGAGRSFLMGGCVVGFVLLIAWSIQHAKQGKTVREAFENAADEEISEPDSVRGMWHLLAGSAIASVVAYALILVCLFNGLAAPPDGAAADAPGAGGTPVIQDAAGGAPE